MKRFILMAGERYYPSGGFEDLHSDWETEELAFDTMRSWVKKQCYSYQRDGQTLSYGECIWVHIYDLQERKTVWKWNGEGGIWLNPEDNQIEKPSDEPAQQAV